MGADPDGRRRPPTEARRDARPQPGAGSRARRARHRRHGRHRRTPGGRSAGLEDVPEPAQPAAGHRGRGLPDLRRRSPRCCSSSAGRPTAGPPTTPSSWCGSRRSSPRCSAPTRWPPTRSSSAASSRPSSGRSTTTALDDVLRGITDAAEAQPADREALAALNSEVNDVRQRDRPGPGQQPAGLPDRRGVPPARPSRDLRAEALADHRGAGRAPTPSAPRTRWPASTRSGCFWVGVAGPGRAVVAQPPDRPALPPSAQRRDRGRRGRGRGAHRGRHGPRSGPVRRQRRPGRRQLPGRGRRAPRCAPWPTTPRPTRACG